MRLTRRGKVVVTVAWTAFVVLVTYLLRDWNYYGGLG